MKNWTDVRTKSKLRKRYAAIIPEVRKIARRCGYAIAIHGSMERDLDLIAAPWVDHALKPETLVLRIETALVKLAYRHKRSFWKMDGITANKPHGRLAYAIPIAHLSDKFENPELRHAYIDLSVMPAPHHAKRDASA